MKRAQIGVIGVSGYIGAELVRLLSLHPAIDLVRVCSRAQHGAPLSTIHRSLEGITTLSLTPVDETLRALDVIFISAPHGESMKTAAEIRAWDAKVKIIDLGADFRLPPGRFEETYGIPHTAADLLGDPIPGSPELFRSKIAAASLVGSPGCFAHCIILALAPLVAAGLHPSEIQISGVTGSTGSGITPKPGTHHPERNDSMTAYNPLRHRHTAEIEYALSLLGSPPKLHFVPHSGPFSRGIFVTAFAKIDVTPHRVREEYERFARSNRFIRLREESPRLIDVRGSNFCDISLSTSGEQLVIFAALDNLIKGAAGNAIQCMNCMMDLPEETGLMMPPLYP